MINWVDGFTHWLLAGLVLLFALILLAGLLIFIADVMQTKHAIRHNYPLIGRFRGWFEHLGVFFRQYFFAMDREEMPFNRAQREWVYRAAKNEVHTVAFGSTRDLHPVGTVYFVNSPFPKLMEDATPVAPVTIGPECPHPYQAQSVFNISAMSYGALSRVAVQALSRGARMSGCWLNTGEGGLSRWHLEGGGDIVFQIGTAKYGVRDEAGRLCDQRLRQIAAHEQVRMFEIKLSQGAKPGKGGILPGRKVTEEIAGIRGIPPGEDSVSPNRHVDIGSPGELMDMIERVRSVTGKPVGFKLVIGDCDVLDQLFEEIHRRGKDSAPDFITVDSADGGTGAAPQSLIDYMGMPLAESLPMVVDHLIGYGLRGRIRVICSGKLVTPSDVAWALCMGADFVNSARGFMFALGCIQAMQCNRNTCPTGITTHNPRLQRGLDPTDKGAMVANYVRNIVHELGVIAHSCGVETPRALRRRHARIVAANGHSMGMQQLFPDMAEGHLHGTASNRTKAETEAGDVC